MKKLWILIVILAILIFVINLPYISNNITSNVIKSKIPQEFIESKMKIESSFKNNAEIPVQYTCNSMGISPPLTISEIPGNAKTIALVMDDPDAPSKTWVHWVIFNIPVSGSSLEIKEGQTPNGIEGIGDSGKGYKGPCPPSGTHRYFFKAYALDNELSLGTSTTKEQLEEEMEGHIIDRAELIGLYTYT